MKNNEKKINKDNQQNFNFSSEKKETELNVVSQADLNKKIKLEKRKNSNNESDVYIKKINFNEQKTDPDFGNFLDTGYKYDREVLSFLNKQTKQYFSESSDVESSDVESYDSDSEIVISEAKKKLIYNQSEIISSRKTLKEIMTGIKETVDEKTYRSSNKKTSISNSFLGSEDIERLIDHGVDVYGETHGFNILNLHQQENDLGKYFDINGFEAQTSVISNEQIQSGYYNDLQPNNIRYNVINIDNNHFVALVVHRGHDNILNARFYNSLPDLNSNGEDRYAETTEVAFVYGLCSDDNLINPPALDFNVIQGTIQGRTSKDSNNCAIYATLGLSQMTDLALSNVNIDVDLVLTMREFLENKEHQNLNSDIKKEKSEKISTLKVSTPPRNFFDFDKKTVGR